MFKYEKKFAEFIEKHAGILYFAIISVIGFFIRYVGREFISLDAQFYFLPWFDEMTEAGGFKGLGELHGDYNVLHQTLVAVMTYLPFYPLTMFKSMSCIFDYFLAFAPALFICGLKKEKIFSPLFNGVYTVILFLPTVVLNSGFWAQCDSMYSFFVITALFMLYKEKYIPAFVLYGVAFAFKFQAIFVLPFFIAVYFIRKNFSALMFLITVVTFWLSGIVTYINGRSLLAPFEIYFSQIDDHQEMYMCARSIWVIFGNHYELHAAFAMLLALTICGLGFYILLTKKKTIATPVSYFNTVAWFMWVCIFFLPGMHERYAYILDLLLIILAFLDKKYIKFAVFSAFLSFMSYAQIMAFDNGILRADVFIELFVFAYFTYMIYKDDQVASPVGDGH